MVGTNGSARHPYMAAQMALTSVSAKHKGSSPSSTRYDRDTIEKHLVARLTLSLDDVE